MKADASRPSGLLFVISAPSGTGKSTVARRLLQSVEGLEFSVSYTTRPQRAAERDGRDYHFVDRERFEAMIRDGALLEWADVFGHLYGTGLDATRKALAEGRSLLLDIDVQGARQVRESPVSSVLVMLLPPSYETLKARLSSRGTESADQLQRRLARAGDELGDYRYFDYVVVNDDIDRTVRDLEAIVTAERRRPPQGRARIEDIINTFPSRDREFKEP